MMGHNLHEVSSLQCHFYTLPNKENCVGSTLMWSIYFPLNSSYDGVKRHFMDIHLSFWNLLSASGQLFCWVPKWTLVLLLVLRFIYLSAETALAVSSHYIFCSICCKLVLSWTLNIFLCGKERFNRKYGIITQWFVSCSKNRFTGKQITNCCL